LTSVLKPDSHTALEPPRHNPRRTAAIVMMCIVVLAALAYLRDPPWLLEMSSGLREWERAADGTRFRWAGAHASFFVPSTAGRVRIPLRTTFDRPGEWPISVSITIDDQPADRLVLSDPGWRESVLRLPPARGRRVRRLDIRADRARDDNRAVQVGEVSVSDGK
jgi:hypothetical protein